MCGDFDEQERIDEELFDRFVEQIRNYGVSPPAGSGDAALQLESESERAAYMETLFRAGLTRCVNDAARLPHGERMDALAGQAIVFARLAGVLAGQFPPDADLFRMITGAMLDGHNERGQFPDEHGHDHNHGHHHAHSH
jgi:hypothetical protein